MAGGKKGCLIIFVIVGVLVLLSYPAFKETHNRLSTLDEEVKTAWAQLESQLQRRMNLIPNFVETIKSYAPHEQEVLGAVTQLHIKAAVTMLQPQRIAINSELTAALDRLSTVAERYPDLKADQSFMRLRDELASIETSIAEETITYNEAARKYNTYAAGFPVVIVATLSGFAQAPLYEAQGLPRSGVESPLPLPGNR